MVHIILKFIALELKGENKEAIKLVVSLLRAALIL